MRKLEETRTIEPLFSLNQDLPGLVNARKTFLELNDPTGYLWTQRYLNGDYKHWEALMRCKWFIEEYDSWLVELKTKFKIAALQQIMKIASGQSEEPASTVLQANKYLATAQWEKAAYDRGRPSKEQMKGELAKAVKTLEAEKEDEDRISQSTSLQVIQGGKG